MVWRKDWLLFAILTFSLSAGSVVIPAYATSPSQEMTFSLVYPCKGNGGMCYPYILAQGIITANTPQDLRAFVLTEHDIPIPKVCFHSTGGDLRAGIKLGMYIRQRSIDTCLLNNYDREVFINAEKGEVGLEVLIENPKCLSACALAFLGGINRKIEDLTGTTNFGTHQFYSEDQKISASQAQSLSYLLNQYVDLMGVGRRFLDLSASTLPHSMRLLLRL